MSTFRETLKTRYAILGAVFLGVLALLLFRLWTMQVLAGPEYALQADKNRVRQITTVAPRGRILDRNGVELVTNRPTLAVLAPSTLHDDDETLARLSALLQVSVPEMKERLASRKEAALAPRVIAIDVPMTAVAYLAEHSAEFPGVEVQAYSVRQYPKGTLAAHVLGYTGEISEDQLGSPEFEGYDPTDVVGKAGAERAFEGVLQGDRGKRVIEVDATGRPQRLIKEIDPEPGRDIRLTIDARVQRVTEKALAQALADARKDGYRKARAGAAVAMDVRTGEVLAMASLPTYDPSVFLGGVSDEQWRSLTSTESAYPLTNRTIMAQYPPASTFKAFVGLAGLEYGKTRQWATYRCEGTWTGMGEQWKKRCWKRSGHGNESFMGGIENSCDIVFYEIGHDFYKEGEERLQEFVRQVGYGEPTGFDLPGEADGRVPDAAWKKAYNEDYPEFQRWNPGDTVNIAIGQGDLLATPLQVTASYAGIAAKGEVPRPHVLKDVLGSDGEVVLSVEPETAFKPTVSAANLRVMHQALVDVTERGTAKDAFSGFRPTVAGKTGTAEVAGKDDYAWFVGYAPAEKPRYAVTVVLEQGGHGGAIAAPAARQILAALLGEKVVHVRARDDSR